MSQAIYFIHPTRTPEAHPRGASEHTILAMRDEGYRATTVRREYEEALERWRERGTGDDAA